VPTILNNIKNFEPGARARKTEEGLRESEQRIQNLVNRLEKLPGGKAKARKARKWASVIRNHIGYREFPKFAYMQRYKIYKEALLEEADKLVDKGVLEERKDIYYLTFAELRATIASGICDTSVLPGRKEDHMAFESLTPPRVMTSDGEVVAGRYDPKGRPAGALLGLAVSAGVIEGRARVIMSLGDVDLEEGDILVTRFTDPSWTPVFASIRALVTEVGGVSTHGAIIAREFGLPAVVSVENATQLIQDGQMIRVSGTEGYVEILS
jgi:pyruvate,water dikinase